MKPWQTLVRYGVIAFAVILIVNLAIWSLTAFGFIFRLSSSGTSDEAQSFEFFADVDELDIDISAAAFTIRAEDCEMITVTTNLKNLTAKESGGKLKVKEKQNFLTVTESDAFVEIVLPNGIEFEKIEIDSGAGRLEISALDTRELDLDLGAGETLLNSITVLESADIDGGAGSLAVRDSVLNSLDLDMGFGELDLEASLGHKCEISVGVGEAKVTLLGNREEYKLKLEKGIGEITVDGTKVGNSVIGDGDISVEIDGGIGNISVSFSEIDE